MFSSAVASLGNLRCWAWSQALDRLATAHDLFAISFNYDINLERILGTLGYRYRAICGLFNNCFNLRPPRQPIILKPHGCIMHDAPMVFRGSANPTFGFAISMQYGEPLVGPMDPWPPLAIPILPNIVPPGHAVSHYISSYLNVVHAVGRRFRETEICIFCGLSADPPDTEEIRGYIQQLPAGCRVIQMGVGSDGRNALAAILKVRADLSYEYFCLSNLTSLPLLIFSL